MVRDVFASECSLLARSGLCGLLLLYSWLTPYSLN